MKKIILKKTFFTMLLAGAIGSLCAQTFTDVTISSGITNPDGISHLKHDGAGATDVMGVGSGAAWFDYDGDGYLDIYITMRTGANKLYQNDGSGNFTDVAAAAEVEDASGDGAGVVVGDINNDGLPDLFLNNCHTDKMFLNDGDGTFTDITASSGLGSALGDRRGTSASFGDYNDDGLLDMYVTHHHMTDGTTAEANRKDFLFFNNGNNTFTDVSSLLPYNDIIGYGFIGAWTDYDQDGDMDIILVNDCESAIPLFNFPTRVFRNDGGSNPVNNWNFTEVSSSVGISDCRNGMGIATGDYDRDGWIDIFYSNIGDVVLFDNNNGSFSDVTVGTGLDIQGNLDYSWGCSFVDYDLDGWLDIFVTLGELRANDEDDRPNQMFKNNGDGTFSEVASSLGLDNPQKSRNGLFADYDNDGDMDLLLVNFAGDIILYRNDVPAAGSNYLKVYAQGDDSNKDAIGARVEIVHGIGGIRQTYEIKSGSNLGGGEEIGAFFGLGSDANVDSLIVTFPNGDVVIQTNVSSNQSVFVSEAGLLPVELAYFDVKKSDETVVLNWSTFSEEQNQYFDIERSADGRSFEKIGQVLGNGTTSRISNYEFIDNLPLKGENYYRLRQVDFNGTETYSEVKIISFESSATEIQIVPNPVTRNNFEVTYKGAEEQVSYLVFDVFGKLIQQDLIQNSETKTVSVDDLPNGIYILRLSGKLIQHTEKIIVSK